MLNGTPDPVVPTSASRNDLLVRQAPPKTLAALGVCDPVVADFDDPTISTVLI